MRCQLLAILHTAALFLKHETYLEGQGDLVSRLITPVTHIVALVLPIINPLTKSDPPSIMDHITRMNQKEQQS